MVFGLTTEEWTAIGALAAVLTLLLSIWGLSRRQRVEPEASADSADDPEPRPKKASPPAEPPDAFDPGPFVVALQEMQSGKALLNIIGAAQIYHLDHDDDPKTPEETETLASALTTLRDYIDINDMMEPGDRVQAAYDLASLIKELGDAGWTVFATTTTRKLRMGDGEAMTCPTAVVSIKRRRQAQAA